METELEIREGTMTLGVTRRSVGLDLKLAHGQRT
jgi:hypothetical protein